MRLETTDSGFVEIIEKANIEKILCRYNDSCTVFFYDKPPKELHTECSVYNAQYGMPVSDDGSKLFVGSWEKGLHAYSTESGELLWKFRPGRIRDIFVYPEFLIVSRAYTSILKLDIETGHLLGDIKSGTLERIFFLDPSYIFADTVSGKHAVIDVEKMTVVKKYSSKDVNPKDCLSLTITSVALQNSTVTIQGLEQYPKKRFDPHAGAVGKPFSRVVDRDFKIMDTK